MRFAAALLIALAWPMAAHSAAPSAPEATDVLAGVKLEPGKTVKVIDPATGGNGYWQVYLPQDYTPSRLWPIIYCYHGSNGEPTVWPFKDLTDGKGFIVIGMEYLDRAAGATRENDLPNLRRIHDVLAKHVALHEQVQFIGGFSQGGWSTGKLSELSLDIWAGIIITGAGRGSSINDPNVKGKAIFIGIGETDPSNAAAKSAAEFYKQHGADVTLEEFKGKAHAVDTADASLRQWLPAQAMKAAGAVLKMKTDLAAAKVAEKAGKLGKAYALYQSVVQNGGDEAPPAQARLDAISQSADKAMADIESTLKEKKYAEATKLLVAAGGAYAGAPQGEQFKSKLEELRTDPAIKAEVEQARADAAASAEESAARTAEKLGDFKRAIAIYERYVVAYPTSAHLAQVREHLATLKSDKSIQAGIASKSVDDQCKSCLGMADNYIRTGYPEKARPYLQKVIDEYPGTSYAAAAKKELAEIR
jgi:tetratricopeptide (TPR) repeat protein